MDEEKKRFWIWVVGISAIIIVLAAVGWFGRPVYRHYKEKQSLARAQAFFTSGDYRNALLSARQALQINTNNAQACRIMADLAGLSRSPAELDWRRRVVEIEANIENKLLLASAGLHYQNPPYPLAVQILDELSTSATNLAAFHLVSTELALRMNRFADAETHLEMATRLEPTNKLYQLNLAVVRLGSTNATTVAAARAALQGFQTDTNLGAAALRSLLVDRLAHNDAAVARDYSSRLLADVKATLGDRLQHLGILRKLSSAELAASLKSLQQQNATNAVAVSEIAAWMLANGFLPDAVQWLSGLPANIQTQAPVRLALADCYLAGNNWRALRDLTSKGKWDEMEFLRLALSSRAWSQFGESFVADSNWRSAVNEAGNRFGALTVLSGLAERWDLKRQREDLLLRLVQKFPNERWARRDLERMFFASGNTAGLNQLYAVSLSLFPKDAGFKNNLAATSLLLKTNLTQACTWAEEVYAQQPGDPIIASTYAYALHLQGRTKEGIAALKKFKNDALEQPAVSLYYGILLSAAGDSSQASHFLAIAATNEQLLPEEKRLLSEAGKTH